MAKSSGAHTTSNGGRQTANLNHEAKRQAKFAAKREAGKAYEYKKNPYAEGTDEWYGEAMERANKTKSHKDEISKMRSILAKLDNEKRENEAKLKRNTK